MGATVDPDAVFIWPHPVITSRDDLPAVQSGTKDGYRFEPMGVGTAKQTKAKLWARLNSRALVA